MIRAAAFAVPAAAVFAAPAAGAPVCSVFDTRPCTLSICSVFDPEPCRPDHGFPLDQGLRLDVQNRTVQGRRPEGPLDTIQDVFAALRGCWLPPPLADVRPGMEISVRLSFTRKGEIMGEPRFTFVTPDTSAEHRAAYQRAVAAALNRCTPLPFGAGASGEVV